MPVELAAPCTDQAAIADLMRRLGVKMTYAKDEEIFGQGEEADRVHMVLSGVVRTARFLSDGRRQIGGFYYPGDLVDVGSGAVHRYSAEAVCASTLLAMRRSALGAAARAAELAIWDATRRELERAQEHLLLLGRKTACERVATFLLDLARTERGGAMTLQMSRQDMADYLGLTIETVSRMMTQLQGGLVIECDGHRTFKVKRWDVLENLAA